MSTISLDQVLRGIKGGSESEALAAAESVAERVATKADLAKLETRITVRLGGIHRPALRLADLHHRRPHQPVRVAISPGPARRGLARRAQARCPRRRQRAPRAGGHRASAGALTTLRFEISRSIGYHERRIGFYKRPVHLPGLFPWILSWAEGHIRAKSVQSERMYELAPGIILAYLSIGLAAGVTAGLLGLGGGIVIVPALLFLFLQNPELPTAPLMQLAVATSLASIIFIAAGASWAHHRRGTVHWSLVRILSPGILIGGLFGALIADQLPSRTLQSVFACFEILVAIQILWQPPRPLGNHLPGRGKMTCAGGIIGAFSTMLGIGGGTLTVPFLLWCKLGMRQAIGTASACGLPIALIGSATLAGLGWQQADLPQPSLGYIYLPASILIALGSLFGSRLGVWLAHRLPVTMLRQLFAVVLCLIGLQMLF